jgi:hypothetical protein
VGVGHRIRIFAAVALAAAQLAGLSASPSAAAPVAGHERSALIVGVGKHTGGRPVGTVGGAGDARVVQEALRRAGWRDDQMRVLVDAAATAAAIREGITWLQSRSNDSSFSIFHYSGHTFQRGGDPDRDGEALDEFLVPYDTRNLLADREVSERLRGIQGWLWANFAGCEAIGFDDAGLSGPRRLVTASSAEPEKSYERPDWRMSVYVGLMFDEGVLKGRADADRDGTVSIHEAFAYAAREAPIMTARQRKGPQNPQMRGGDGQPWFLAPPPPPPPSTPPSPLGPPGRQRLCLGTLCLL